MNTKKPCLRQTSRIVATSVLLSLLLVGCASTDNASPGAPVLYPNAAYKSMGELAAKQHLSQCVAQAQASGLSPGDERHGVAAGAKMGAAVAGVTGAVTGLVLGRGHVNDALKYGAQSAVIGAAAGATRGAMNPQQANPVFRQFVQRCASERGLEVIGWQ